VVRETKPEEPEIVPRYNMLAVPLVNHEQVTEGMVVIDDIVDDLLGDRRMSNVLSR
jgi:Mg/Co/Ni transporter MgtE